MTFASSGGGGHHGLRKISRNPVYRYVNLPCCVKRAVSRSLCDVVGIDQAGTVKMALRVTGAHNVLDCEMAWNTLFPLKTHN